MFQNKAFKISNPTLYFVRNYAFKSDLKIKWIRPEKIPSHRPEKSGDLEPMHDVDRTQILPEFQNSKELQTADDLVKRLFALEFAPRKRSTEMYRNQLMSAVRRHNFDTDSEEVKIAKWTGMIRSLQDLVEKFPKYTKFRVQLQEIIDIRNRHLKYMRRWDYKKYEWLLEKLNIVYKPVPLERIKVTRKDSLRKLTKKYCDEIREDRLQAYKLQLQAEQPAFLQEKIRTLEYIRDDQMKCNVEVTVTQEEIDSAKKQLEELLKRNDAKTKEEIKEE